MSEILLGMIAMFGSIWILSLSATYLITTRGNRPFKWDSFVLATRVAVLTSAALCVFVGLCELSHGHRDSAAYLVAILIVAYWPIKWFVRHRLATAPQRRQHDEERRQQAEQRKRESETNAKRKRAILDLTLWYKEQETLLAAVPEDAGRDTLLLKLYERYDQLVKEKLEEATP